MQKLLTQGCDAPGLKALLEKFYYRHLELLATSCFFPHLRRLMSFRYHPTYFYQTGLYNYHRGVSCKKTEIVILQLDFLVYALFLYFLVGLLFVFNVYSFWSLRFSL